MLYIILRTYIILVFSFSANTHKNRKDWTSRHWIKHGCCPLKTIETIFSKKQTIDWYTYTTVQRLFRKNRTTGSQQQHTVRCRVTDCRLPHGMSVTGLCWRRRRVARARSSYPSSTARSPVDRGGARWIDLIIHREVRCHHFIRYTTIIL